MQKLRNKVQLIGNLGRDPEVRETKTGKKVANFTIATNETYKNQNGEKVEETQWHNVVAWGKLAEISEKFLSKGKEVAIEGKLATRSYDDKEGVRRYVTEIIANDMLLLKGQKVEADTAEA